MITEDMYKINITILIEEDSVTYEYNSFARGYYAYINILIPLIGEILNCKREK